MWRSVSIQAGVPVAVASMVLAGLPEGQVEKAVAEGLGRKSSGTIRRGRQRRSRRHAPRSDAPSRKTARHSVDSHHLLR